MTTSLMRVMSAINETTIAKYWTSYFRERFRGEINDHLLEAFRSSGLTKADIARKLDRRPEQVTRWLSAPCNLEADTISDIALSLGMIPKLSFERIGEANSNCRVHHFVAHYEEPNDDDYKKTGTNKFIYPPQTDSAARENTASSSNDPSFKDAISVSSGSGRVKVVTTHA